MIRALTTIDSLPTLRPWFAGTLSAILPGAGYLYAHRPGTAFTSLVINALFIWSFSDALHRENYGLASLLGLFGSGWYVGNIKGSADAAEQYNFDVRNGYIDTLLEKVDVDTPSK